MSEIKAMTKRNLLIYFRNKSAVFFSILSALILLAIMVVFLGESSSEGLLDALNQYGTGTAEENAKNASWLVQLWIMGGILGVNSVTVSLTAIGAMVEDEERGRLRSFYVTPASRFYLSLGYILSAWVSGMVICLTTLAVGEGFFALKGHPVLGIVDLVSLVGVMALNTFVFSAIGYLAALFIRTGSAWSGMLTVAGTLVGFLGGTYIPVASMSEWLQNVVKLLPVIHGTALITDLYRTVFCLRYRTDCIFRTDGCHTKKWRTDNQYIGTDFTIDCLGSGCHRNCSCNRKKKKIKRSLKV